MSLSLVLLLAGPALAVTRVDPTVVGSISTPGHPLIPALRLEASGLIERRALSGLGLDPAGTAADLQRLVAPESPAAQRLAGAVLSRVLDEPRLKARLTEAAPE